MALRRAAAQLVAEYPTTNLQKVVRPIFSHQALRAARRLAASVLDALSAELVIVGVDEALAHCAGELADERGLRGHEAVHSALALALGPGETIVVTGDRDLSNAAVGAGLAVAPPSDHGIGGDSDRPEDLARAEKAGKGRSAVSIHPAHRVAGRRQPTVFAGISEAGDHRD